MEVSLEDGTNGWVRNGPRRLAGAEARAAARAASRRASGGGAEVQVASLASQRVTGGAAARGT